MSEGNSHGVWGNSFAAPRLVGIASPMKAAGKQPRFADLGKNCAVLVVNEIAVATAKPARRGGCAVLMLHGMKRGAPHRGVATGNESAL